MSQKGGDGATVEFRLGQFSSQLGSMDSRLCQLEAHGKSMYGNGSGKKGYIERQFSSLTFRFYVGLAFVVLLVERAEWHIPVALVASPLAVSVGVEVVKKLLQANGAD